MVANNFTTHYLHSVYTFCDELQYSLEFIDYGYILLYHQKDQLHLYVAYMYVLHTCTYVYMTFIYHHGRAKLYRMLHPNMKRKLHYSTLISTNTGKHLIFKCNLKQFLM